MPQRFTIGDRVIAQDEQTAGVPKGTVGTVVQIFLRVPEICDVAFDGYAGLRLVFTNQLDPVPPDADAPEST